MSDIVFCKRMWGEDGFSIAYVPEWLNPVRNRLAFYYVALMLVCLTFLFLRRLIQSPTGAVLLAIRENENRAQSIGYNTLVFKLIAIILAGLLAALAGMLSVMLNKKVGPELLNVSYTVDPLLMTIIGGIGTHTGPVIGAAVLHLSDRLLRNQLAIGNAWTLVQGIGFIVVVLVLPGGIAQLWRRNPASKPRAPKKSQPEVESSKAVVP